MIKITVDTPEQKAELLAALYHIHGADINTDIPMVNEIVHVYNNPDLITVRNPYSEPERQVVEELPNGDVIYEDNIWWDFEGRMKGRNPIRTNWDDPRNIRLTFDCNGNLKDAVKI